MQERRNSIANAQEFHLSCTNPSICIYILNFQRQSRIIMGPCPVQHCAYRYLGCLGCGARRSLSRRVFFRGFILSMKSNKILLTRHNCVKMAEEQSRYALRLIAFCGTYTQSEFNTFSSELTILTCLTFGCLQKSAEVKYSADRRPAELGEMWMKQGIFIRIHFNTIDEKLI